VLYANEYTENLEQLLTLIENDDATFKFCFGKELLANAKYKIRDPNLLE